MEKSEVLRRLGDDVSSVLEDNRCKFTTVRDLFSRVCHNLDESEESVEFKAILDCLREAGKSHDVVAAFLEEAYRVRANQPLSRTLVRSVAFLFEWAHVFDYEITSEDVDLRHGFVDNENNVDVNYIFNIVEAVQFFMTARKSINQRRILKWKE